MTRALGMHGRASGCAQLRVNTQSDSPVGGTRSTDSSHGVGGIRPRLQPYWRSNKEGLRESYKLIHEAIGCLYGVSYDEREAMRIREACEELGLPMGYGRVHATPECIDPEELPPLFRNVSHQ